MKKFILCICALFILMGFVFSQKVSFSQPKADSKWTAGKKHTIQWAESGKFPAYVKLSLHDPGERSIVKVIIRRTRNNGKYEWTIPGDVPPGNYEVWLTTVDETLIARSEAFEIVSPAMMTRTSPLKQAAVPRSLAPVNPTLKKQHLRIKQNLNFGTKSRLDEMARSLYEDAKSMNLSEFNQAVASRIRKDFPHVSQRESEVILFYALNEIDTQLRSEIERSQSTVADMSEMDMLDLQNAMQKEAQLMQMLSNMLKIMHETSMSIIRNIK